MRYTPPKFYERRGVVITAAEFEAWYEAQPKRPIVPREVAATFVGYLRYRADAVALDLADALEREGVVIGWAQDLIDFAGCPSQAHMDLYRDWDFAKRDPRIHS